MGTCPICLQNDQIQEDSTIVKPNCACKNKQFHRFCLNRWFAISSKCPLCNTQTAADTCPKTSTSSLGNDEELNDDAIIRALGLDHESEPINIFIRRGESPAILGDESGCNLARPCNSRPKFAC